MDRLRLILRPTIIIIKEELVELPAKQKGLRKALKDSSVRQGERLHLELSVSRTKGIKISVEAI